MNNLAKGFLVLASASGLSACAGIDLGEKGLTYYDPVPYVLITTNPDCTKTLSAVTLPGEKRKLDFKNGLGSADINVTLANGMITQIGQKTDSKILETMAALVPLITAARGEVSTKAVCSAALELIPIKYPEVVKLR